jgi:hypothetical protein
VLKYIVPVVVFSAIFNIPKFFETTVIMQTFEEQV